MGIVSRAPRTATAIATAGFVCSSMTSCFGDPSPDPATAPLEVVLEGCTLNRTEVGSGRHDVSVIGQGRVIITDEAGAEMLSLPGSRRTLITTGQTYAFTCSTATGSASSLLRST